MYITDRFGHVAVLLYLMWMAYCHVQAAEIRVEDGPRDATVHEGDNVTFVCNLENVKGYSIIWGYQSGSTSMYLTRNRAIYTGDQQASQSVTNRLSIVGDMAKEEFSLRIQNVIGSDSGEYSCQYTPSRGGGLLTTAGMAAILTVLVPPTLQSPTCRVDPSETGFTVGDQVNLVCSTVGGNPFPNITLTMENKIILEAYQTASIAHLYVLNDEDNGVVFTCTMTTPALDAPRNCSVMPLVILPSVNISPVLSTVEEGANILLKCNAEGVPSIHSFSWKVIKTNSQETLAPDKYSLSNDGRTLSMQVKESIELYCIASVPSGLSNNSTVRIEVTLREETITEEMNTQEYTTDPHQPSLSSPITTIIVVVSALVVILIIIIILIQWQRRKKRKSKIPIDPKVGYKMSEMDDEYDETERRNRTKSMANDETINDDQDSRDVFPDNVLYAIAGNTAKQDGQELENGAPTPRATVYSPHDMSAIYAQPNKKPKHPKHHNDGKENTYSAVADEEPIEVDSGLLYADLDLDKHGPDENNTQPEEIHSNEQTVYAMIRI